MPREAYILIVDDDPLILTLLTMRLEKAGFNVTTANDAWQEVLQAQGVKVGLVITDIQMPGFGSGIDAYKQLRQLYPQLPVIFITGLEVERARQMIPQDPRVRLVTKPIDFELMRKAIKELTGVDRAL